MMMMTSMMTMMMIMVIYLASAWHSQFLMTNSQVLEFFWRVVPHTRTIMIMMKDKSKNVV